MAPFPGQLRPRQVLAGALLAAGLAALAAGALSPDLPFGDSVRMARRFWQAGPRSRLLNAPFFAREAGFVASALDASRRLPRGTDVALVLDPSVPPATAEELRRRAAYVLAPRRVRLEPGKPGDRLLVPMPSGANAR